MGWSSPPLTISLADCSIEWIYEFEEHSIFRRSRLPFVKKQQQRVATLASKSPNCYFHWMCDILPRLQLLEEAGLPYDVLCLPPLKKAFQRETVALLGLDPQKLHFVDSGTHLECDTLIVPSMPSYSGCVPTWVADYLKQAFLDPSQLPRESGRRIYVKRANAASRRIVNEGEVETVLRDYGFECLALETLSVKEQAQLFASSAVVVAPHGAGLSNLVFCSPGCRVLEIFHPGYTNDCYWKISQNLGLEHEVAFLEPLESLGTAYDGVVDPLAIQAFLDKL